MVRLRVTKAVTLCAAVAFAATMGTASAAPGAAPSAVHAVAQPSKDTVLVDCLWKPHVRPADFVLACGDGNSRLTSLRWSQWDTDKAVAKGRNLVNDCAAGRFHSYPVVVRLDHPEKWTKHPHQQRYDRMKITYTADRPERLERVVTYQLWN
ncbi:hypothetical protein AB0I77_25835 [Streptomyces sp. NPDC050619]|uniref:hypothetical protein n=1 Tax=Streptomyces sp. NPDC050619 TaxID=3157214 RepID=UPI003449F715